MVIAKRMGEKLQMASACQKASLVIVPASIAATIGFALATGDRDWLVVGAVYSLVAAGASIASILIPGVAQSCPMANPEDTNAG